MLRASATLAAEEEAVDRHDARRTGRAEVARPTTDAGGSSQLPLRIPERALGRPRDAAPAPARVPSTSAAGGSRVLESAYLEKKEELANMTDEFDRNPSIIQDKQWVDRMEALVNEVTAPATSSPPI